jgi:NADPH:quinone reductase-like Zn-dependent oxidoreductase
MKAYLLRRSGKPRVLRLAEVPEPEPNPGQVKVRLQFAGLNYSEVLSRKGLYGWALKRPYIPGMEGVGEIISVGTGVPENRIGEKVIVGVQYGCYAEYVCTSAAQALPVFADLEPVENAALLVNYLTAWVALIRMGRLTKDESLLITAAAGGVGTAAIQIARHIGARIFGMAGTDDKVAFIESLGVQKGFNYNRAGIFDQMHHDTNGFDVVLEMYGGEVYRKALMMLNPFGRMVVMGYASLDLKYWNPVSIWRAWRGIPRVSIPDINEQSVGVMSSHLGYLLKNPDLIRSEYDEMIRFITEHRIKPIVDRAFPFDALPEAHQYIEDRRQKGKVVLEIQ